MRVKIFYNLFGQDLEDAVNKWLGEAKSVEITDVKYMACGGGNSEDAFESWSVMIVYKYL